jgi:hypothetical protein
MATKRKGWESLSDSYRKRLTRSGISKSEYQSGKSIAKARGHAATPEHGGYKKTAGRAGIAEYIPEFFELDREEQERIGKAWIDGFMSKGKGPIANPHRKKGERIRRKASDRQIIARMDFIEWMDENEGGFDKEDWAGFREAYKATFSA